MEENLKSAINLFEALLEGKTLEVQSETEFIEAVVPNPVDIVTNPEKYRIKDTITIPFKDREECLQSMRQHFPVGWLKEKTTSYIFPIQGIFTNEIQIKDITWTFETCSRFFDFSDGTAFGKIIKNKQNN